MRLFALVLGVISSPVAWSHGVHAAEPHFVSGLLHPMTGIDHVLAAVGIGLWLGVQAFTRSSIPLYSVALAAGLVQAGVWAGAGGGLAGIEWILAFTLIVVGLLLCKPLQLPRSLVAAFISLIFCCHFCAHIMEISNAAGAFFYTGGFFIGTAWMIVAGAMVGDAATRRGFPGWLRIAGATIATAGVTALGLA